MSTAALALTRRARRSKFAIMALVVGLLVLAAGLIVVSVWHPEYLGLAHHVAAGANVRYHSGVLAAGDNVRYHS
jgi:hypothetical protein